MQTLTSSPASRGTGVPARLVVSSRVAGAVTVLAAFVLILAATRSTELGDTRLYANDIVDHLGKSPFGPGNSLWDFGHLFWRPAGWAIVSLFSGAFSATGWPPFMQASFALVAFSCLSSLVTVVLLYSLIAGIVASRKLAIGIALALACSNGFLLYSHSGTAYLPGLMFTTASLYFLNKNRIPAAAVFYSIAVLLWLPYVLAGPALLLFAVLPGDWTPSLRERARRLRISPGLRFILISAVCLAVGFGAGLAARRISSVQEAREWYASSSHGWSQSITGVRLATGLPRSLLTLGEDGVQYKRYLKHDPYNPVNFSGILKAGLWRIVVFYIFAACLLWELIRSPGSGWPLLILLAGAGPVIFFAVFLFEPGSPERYLPAFPFVALAIAWVIRDLPRNRNLARMITSAFLACVLANNGYAYFAPRVSGEDQSAWQRVRFLRAHLTPGGFIALATNQDPIESFVSRALFADVNRPDPLPVYDIVEPATSRVSHWRGDFAARALECWKRGGEVWISKRVWAERPLADWNWVEGDDRRVTWKVIPSFFSLLETDAETEGPDGFRRLARNDGNEGRLSPLAIASGSNLNDAAIATTRE